MIMSICLKKFVKGQIFLFASMTDDTIIMTDDDDEVQRIIHETNLYKILKIDQTANKQIITRNYRKIAQAVHPDRCKSDKASEAFQKVSHACQTLINDEKRKNYDISIDRLPQQQEASNHGQTDFDDEMTPEEFFTCLNSDESKLSRINRKIKGAKAKKVNSAQNKKEPQGKGKPFAFIIKIIITFIIFAFTNPEDVRHVYEFIVMLFFNPISKDSLQGVLSFSPQNQGQTMKLNCKKYGVSYYIPSWWVNSIGQDIIVKNRNKLNHIAEEMYVEELIIQCELEKNQLGKEGPKCAKMRKIVVV
ncbi:hypothetical protein TRFO_16402 [Tritrichomonas foetus]|uniref:J domain-containing protein n=1 Tax=Tritrichomonas foetus TaxID=1144522 RepID=A0A1J4KUS7_9EUKA|nr:hypothetical protein TRFO_16402 [Tritrichomonas foetus]|eukprot:OHT13422.1 hypothetical protein TRFO_16402 [Tritrichomonas foetus]